ncbi:hypothetical protein BT93_D2069 [Corymbia citriodora subsp. variegata]|nr:hypothetical protein BT93_D2069 [Corymbia citriodora subsp. variegata]
MKWTRTKPAKSCDRETFLDATDAHELHISQPLDHARTHRRRRRQDKTRTQNRLASASSNLILILILIVHVRTAHCAREQGINTSEPPHRSVVPEVAELRFGFPAKASKLFDSQRERIVEEEKKRMMMVAIVAEIMEVYTEVLTRAMEHLLREAPLPRRVRFLILRSLPFASPPRPRLIGAPPAPVPVRVAA